RSSTLFPYTTLFRSVLLDCSPNHQEISGTRRRTLISSQQAVNPHRLGAQRTPNGGLCCALRLPRRLFRVKRVLFLPESVHTWSRSEEHTSELQSREN